MHLQAVESVSCRAGPGTAPNEADHPVFVATVSKYEGFWGIGPKKQVRHPTVRSTRVQRKRLSTDTMRVQTVSVDGRMGNVLNPTRSRTMAKTKKGPKRTNAVQVEKTARPVRLDRSESDHERLDRCTRERGLNKASSARQAVLERIKADESGGK